MTITLTDNLVKRIKTLRNQQGNPALNLRLTVNGGGCQGFEYVFTLDPARRDGDIVFEKDGVAVVTDEVSLPFLEGAEIDYVDELIGAYFKVNNPNAASSCGCGTSFAVKD